MRGYIDENNWVDLSELPQIHGDRIHWEKSVGLSINFKYKGTEGKIVILEHRPRQHGVRVFVQNYTSLDGYTLETYALTHCQLGGLLRKNILLNAPHVIKYLVNKDDKLLPCGSQIMIDVKCPICGLQKRTRVIELTKFGFCCNRCSDGISYPNKFILNLLDQSGCIYDYEVSKAKHGYTWLKNYRYDFSIDIDDRKYLIEADGGYHYKNYFDKAALDCQQKRDAEKNLLATQHGFDIIRINCDYGCVQNRYSFIKESVLNSKLRALLRLDDLYIDWDACDRAGCTNLYVHACDYWNSGIRCVSEIAKIMKIDPETARRYLSGGAQYGLCDYDARQALSEAAERRSRPIAIYDTNNNLINVFRNYKILIDQSKLIFGRQFNKSSVYACCSGRTEHMYGYRMKYITIQEYEHFINQACKPTNNTKLI